MNWINVNDKLPQIEQDVLVCCLIGDHDNPVFEYFVAWYDGNEWYDNSDGAWLLGVTNWFEIIPPTT